MTDAPRRPDIWRLGGALTPPAVLVHGGAGSYRDALDTPTSQSVIEAMGAALQEAWDRLIDGEQAMPAAAAAVASMEDSGLFNAGRGAVPTSDGRIETDAAVMDGASGAAGAVCAATWPANPVRAALLVASLDYRRGGPLLVAGAGADRLAAASGLAGLGDEGARPSGGTSAGDARPGGGPGTVGAVTLDRAGHVAAATSTGGRAGQLPGRVGDSPVIGAGTWADDSTAAISATGDGEAFVVAGFAHQVHWGLRTGATLGQSVVAALSEVARRGGTGGAITIRPSGRFAVAFTTAAMAFGWRDAGTLEHRIGRLSDP